jgi:hypothetical protein
MATVVVAARIPPEYLRSLQRIAELRRSTPSGVLAQLIIEQIEPEPDVTNAGITHEQSGAAA